MRARTTLPSSLGDSFHIRDAGASGVGRGRCNAPDLERPFPGVRSQAVPATFRARIAAYLPRIKPRQRFVGVTAARLWGLPLPWAWTPRDLLDIAVPQESTPPRTRGVAGRRLNEGRARTWHIDGAPVVDPVTAVFTCASLVTDKHLVILVDALLATASVYPGSIQGRPEITRADIAARLDDWGPFPGCGRVREALRHARTRVESPKETESRLMITSAGLPEPTIQFDVRTAGGRLVARVDLAYPELRIAIEYEGDGHRTDKLQWRRDIQRQRDLEDLGWTVIRLTELDLRSPAPALARIRRALALTSR